MESNELKGRNEVGYDSPDTMKRMSGAEVDPSQTRKPASKIESVELRITDNGGVIVRCSKKPADEAGGDQAIAYSRPEETVHQSYAEARDYVDGLFGHTETPPAPAEPPAPAPPAA